MTSTSTPTLLGHALLSWKAAKGLTILPEHYPNPVPAAAPHIAATTTNQPSLTPDVRGEFPSIFDGQVRTMDDDIVIYDSDPAQHIDHVRHAVLATMC